MSRKTSPPQPRNPWNEYGVSSFPPQAPMVGQEQVHRHLDSALKNFQPGAGSSTWFGILTSTWGGGKTRTADELVSQVTGQSCGWIDRSGAMLPVILKPDFADGLLPIMVSYKWVIQQVEVANRMLPFTQWIPRVALAALIALRDKVTPQLKAVMEHLETFKNPVAQAIRSMPKLASVTDEKQVVRQVLDVMKAHGMDRMLVLVEEVEDVTEIRNKPGGNVLGADQYQQIKDIYLEVLPEVLKSDTARQDIPELGFLLLCSPAVYSTVEKIPSQARRYYPIPIGRNTVAELRGFLNRLRTSEPSLPEYKSDAGDLLATAYIAVDRNMGWLNVVMYSRHRRWLESEHDPVSLLREFADGDPRGKEVFVENGLARIPGADGLAQKLLYGQMPVAINTIGDTDRGRLLGMKVLDTASSKAFVELHPLRATLSELLETAHQDAGVQVISGGGATVMAGDMKIDLARLLDDLAAYKTDDAGRPVLPKDRDAFVLHLTALHGISQTGAAAQYLYPVFAKHVGETATHFGPSFAALRQIDKRLQREDLQFRLLDDEEQERKFNQLVAGLSGADRQRRLLRGLLRVLEENQAPAEMSAEPSVVVASAKIERTDALLLSQDSKIWMVAGNRGSSARDVVESLCTQDKPVYPILLLLSTDDPSQRDLIDQFLQNRPAIAERVFQFSLAEVDERLLILKSENYGDDALTNLARSLLYRLTERSKQALADRFNQLVTLGVVVWPVFRNDRWKPHGEALAELWLYLAADASHSLIDAEARFGQNRVQNAKDALDENRPTAKKRTTPLVDHDSTPPKPIWPAGLARLVGLLKDGPKSVDWLTRRFFGAGDRPRPIVEQMLQWLEKMRLVVRNPTDDMYHVLTRSEVERAAEAAQSWHDHDLTTLLADVTRYTGIQSMLQADGAEMKTKLRDLMKVERLEVFQKLGQTLSIAADQAIDGGSDHAACVAALALLLDFEIRQMRTGGAAQGETLAQDAQALEEHVRNRDLPFRDLADALGVFVKKLEARVTQLHGQISTAKADYKGRLDAARLPSTVFEAPAESLLILTKRDQQLAHTTKGVLASDTLIHHLVQRNLKKAEQCVEEAEQRLARLKTGCDTWIQSWDGFAKQVKSLKQEHDAYEQQVKELTPRAGDSVFVNNHLAQLKTLLKPKLDEAGDVLEGLQYSLDGDYAEQVRTCDQGNAPFDGEGNPALLKEANKLIEQLETSPQVSTQRLRELLAPLSRAKAEHVNVLMQDEGTPSDPGLGLLRFAMARLDENSSLNAQQRLEGSASLRSLVEEAAKLRDEWRATGPQKLGDPDLFTFFLKVVAETGLGNKAIPTNTDWEKLGKLKDLNLLTLKLT